MREFDARHTPESTTPETPAVFELPAGVDNESRASFEKLYEGRLLHAMQNVEKVIETLTLDSKTRGASFHDGTDPNRDHATFQKPLSELYFFPFRKRFGAQTGLLASKTFTRLRSLHFSHISTRRFLAENRIKQSFFEKFNLFRASSDEDRFIPHPKGTIEDTYVQLHQDNQQGVLNVQKEATLVSSDVLSLADSVDQQVAKELKQLNKDRSVRELMDKAIQSIAANLTVSGAGDGLPQDLHAYLKRYLQDHPKLQVQILAQSATFLADDVFSRTLPAIERMFSQQDLVDFESWLHKKLGAGKKKDHELKLSYTDGEIGMEPLEKYLSDLQLKDLSNVYRVPSYKYLQDITLPTAWFKRGIWILHWSKSADMFRAVGERLRFMSSDIAPDKLAIEPGIQEGLALISAIQVVKLALLRCTQVYNDIRRDGIRENRALPFVVEPRGYDWQTDDILKLVQKSHAYDYKTAIQSSQDSLNKYVADCTTAADQLQQNLAASAIVHPEIVLFEKYLNETKTALAAVRSKADGLFTILKEYVEITDEEYNFSHAIIPVQIDGEGEVNNAVDLPIEPASRLPRLETVMTESQATRAVTLDDLLSQMGIGEEQPTQEQKSKRS